MPRTSYRNRISTRLQLQLVSLGITFSVNKIFFADFYWQCAATANEIDNDALGFLSLEGLLYIERYREAVIRLLLGGLN
jgi:hypothetical protein